jgi:hypothetical protein
VGCRGLFSRIVKPGQRFGRLVVVRALRRYGRYRYAYRQLCRCDCGPLVKVGKFELLNGDTRSCGCYQKSHLARRSRGNGFGKTHGMSGTKMYQSHKALLSRCLRTTDRFFHRYGGAGVKVCDRWNPKAGGSFENFLADMGIRPEGTTLSRYADVGDYCKSNCAWHTPAEQAHEARRKGMAA